MSFILIFLVGLSAVASAAPPSDGPDCGPFFADAFDLPTGWGISPAELAEIANHSPDVVPDIVRRARLARFISLEGDEFFELFGSYAHLGHARATYVLAGLKPGGLTPLFHRRMQLTQLQTWFVDRGVLPDDLDDQSMDFLTHAYGPLDWEDRAAATAAIRTGQIKPVMDRALEGTTMRFRDLVAHSAYVQAFVLAQVRDPKARKFAPEVEVRAWQDFMDQAVPPGQDPDLTALVDRAERLVRQEYFPPRLNLRAGVPKGAGAAVARRHIERELLGIGLSQLLGQGYWETEGLKPDSTSTPLDDPFVRMVAFDRMIERTTFIDRGLAPALRRIFAVVMLDRPVMTSSEAKRRVADRLKVDFTALRSTWRAMKAERDADTQAPIEPAPPASSTNKNQPKTEAPTRAERLASYERAMRDAARLVSPRSSEMVPPEAPLQPKRPSVTNALWTDLLDPSRSLAEARAYFRDQIEAERVYVFRLIRTGFRHRVEFSKDLIEQLIDPKPGEPEDVREWIETILEGPARKHGQSGWRKFSTVVNGRFWWEIKIPKQPYRILGIRQSSGVWRFERIERMH